MIKNDLLQCIEAQLEAVYKNAIASAQRAHHSATDKENVAENKYDTLGLEAAYLAEGQSRRVLECEEDLKAFQQLRATAKDNSPVIKIGSVVKLEDEQGEMKFIFLGLSAGGLKVSYLDYEIMLVTDSAPLGKALIGLEIEDDVTLTLAGEKRSFTVLDCM